MAFLRDENGFQFRRNSGKGTNEYIVHNSFRISIQMEQLQDWKKMFYDNDIKGREMICFTGIL